MELGRYRVIRELGKGGMGLVYLAEDPMLGREVAIKTIRMQESDADKEKFLMERFLREARIVAKLSHPNIVTIHDLFQQDDAVYVVMEFVPGRDLGVRLRESPTMDPAEVARIIAQAGAALDHAHSKGIVHRDVKPANMLIHQDGDVKVTDFGIAKLSTASTQTTTGVVMGTIDYMSPEQVQSKPVDGRSDLYSLAVMAFRLLTGKKVFDAESLVTLAMKIVNEPPPAPSAINSALPKAVDGVIAKALAKSPDDRYANCAAFAHELELAISSPEAEAAPKPETAAPQISTPVATQASAPKQQRGAYLAAAALAVIAGVGYLVWPKPPAPSPQKQAVQSASPAKPDVAKLLEDGAFAEASGEYGKAYSLYRQAVVADPSNPTAASSAARALKAGCAVQKIIGEPFGLECDAK